MENTNGLLNNDKPTYVLFFRAQCRPQRYDLSIAYIMCCPDPKVNPTTQNRFHTHNLLNLYLLPHNHGYYRRRRPN